MRAVILLRQVFYVIYDRSTSQFYHWKGDCLSGCYTLGSIEDASRFDTKKAAINEAEADICGPYEIRKCTATWKMSQ